MSTIFLGYFFCQQSSIQLLEVDQQAIIPFLSTITLHWSIISYHIYVIFMKAYVLAILFPAEVPGNFWGKSYFNSDVLLLKNISISDVCTREFLFYFMEIY